MDPVTVEATQDHTCHGCAYAVGDQYDTDEPTAVTLEAQGKAKRLPVKTKAATVSADAPVQRTTAVAPMTTDGAGLVIPKARNRTTAAPRTQRPKAKGKAKARK